MQNQVRQLLVSLQKQLSVTLQSNRETLCHPVAKGDATEDEWLCLLKNHLPNRYQADRAFVIDSEGKLSEQIDIVIYDRQYTPLLYNQNNQIFVPAESVYAILEVKQELDLDKIQYAGKKISSVRNLKRTSAKIVDVGKSVAPRPVTAILGGILTSDSLWNPPFGESFQKAINSLTLSQRVDLGIALLKGSFDVSYTEKNEVQTKIEVGETALLYFFFNLLWRLQRLGTVPAIDYAEYLKVIDELS
ncbi:MAG: hypothetical protein H0W58_13815 [Acidobacteria bacterium]|jgi:hypothetical protein|nr:hypothetical protein [Acidobacteriota bacterium]